MSHIVSIVLWILRFSTEAVIFSGYSFWDILTCTAPPTLFGLRWVGPFYDASQMHDMITIRTRPNWTVRFNIVITNQTLQTATIDFTLQLLALRAIRRIDPDPIRFGATIGLNIVAFTIFRFEFFVFLVGIWLWTGLRFTVCSAICVAWLFVQLAIVASIIMAISFFLICRWIVFVIFIFTPVIPIAIVFIGSATILSCAVVFAPAIIIVSFLTLTRIKIAFDKKKN